MPKRAPPTIVPAARVGSLIPPRVPNKKDDQNHPFYLVPWEGFEPPTKRIEAAYSKSTELPGLTKIIIL